MYVRRRRRVINHSIAIPLLYLVICAVLTFLVLNNLSFLNEYALYFIQLGTALLVLTGFFTLKYFFRVLARIRYFHPNSRLPLKYFFGIVLLVLAVLLVFNQDVVVDAVGRAFEPFDTPAGLVSGNSVPEGFETDESYGGS